MDENTLLKTIRIPKNILFLSNKLPKANYESPTVPNIKIIKNINNKPNSLPRNNTLLLPSISKVNNRYSKIQNLKEIQKNNYNIVTDSLISKNDITFRNKSKESLIIPLKNHILSPLNKLPFNNKSNNKIIKNQRPKNIFKQNLCKPKNNGLSKGLSELFKLYVSNDLNGNNGRNSNSNKFALYMRNIYHPKKVAEKRSNSNSCIANKDLSGKKIVSPLNIKV